MLTPLILLTLLLAACGDSTSEVGTGSGAEKPTPVEPDGGIGDGAEPIPDELPSADPVDEEVITDFEPVDGKITDPTEVVVNPDNPSELWVRFIGGAAPCTAANVTVLTETPTEIVIELVVGITSDALVKSCLAGEFNLRLDVGLNEPATGKSISWSAASASDGAMQLTPDLTTDDFVGLPEAAAAELADKNQIAWRISRIDGEPQVVTTDYSPTRLNFEMEGGVVTAVTTG